MDDLEIEEVIHGTIVDICSDKNSKSGKYGVSVLFDRPCRIFFTLAYDGMDFSKYRDGQRVVYISLSDGTPALMDEEEFNKKIEKIKREGGRRI